MAIADIIGPKTYAIVAAKVYPALPSTVVSETSLAANVLVLSAVFPNLNICIV